MRIEIHNVKRWFKGAKPFPDIFPWRFIIMWHNTTLLLETKIGNYLISLAIGKHPVPAVAGVFYEVL
jgi:hypothetical protein